MKQPVVAVVAAVSLACITSVRAQTTTLRYGQIPSTIKSVSALHFNIAQRKGLFIREGMNIEMISMKGGAAT
jgi:ABC-type nitrate/sulfonate/bicarbonate transport system substrate-binding protein